uniref:Fucolectin tachylectin-4 pentraxin-1 domain-containing protein n=1 Tax=Scleropages formosus TaxID=113540 RepID=A0A8C9RL69_SCLFO
MRTRVVFVLLWLAVAPSGLVPCVSTETNVALGKMATQSSEWNSKTGAIKANDGNPNSVFRQNSCSCTKRETAPWWRVNLVREFIVSSVTITNRGDCCSERINGAEIRIGNSLENNGNSNPRCATIPSIPPGGASTFHCHGMRGRYVNIYLPRTDYLTLCEVVVAGSPTFGQ